MFQLSRSTGIAISSPSSSGTTRYQTILPDPTVRDVFAKKPGQRPEEGTTFEEIVTEDDGMKYRVRHTSIHHDTLTLTLTLTPTPTSCWPFSVISSWFASNDQSIQRKVDHRVTMTTEVIMPPGSNKVYHVYSGPDRGQMRENDDYKRWLEQTELNFELDNQEPLNKYGRIVEEKEYDDYEAGKAEGTFDHMEIMMFRKGDQHEYRNYNTGGTWEACTAIRRDDCINLERRKTSKQAVPA
ncbi:uncharacterized protein I303_105469 [Kwoniella dejecticola CBS 10117]|uniref:Uncharacterized protein n=1 Tax=Kwoniella dejecticola CBS 10117 TaxID=1296121 RepID=A0A1A6A2E3_9TREE|nr:uncharacterized protein I303_05089 [Kwoniella dejecticola CBS 10117]OBR84232.1 hypothetical protein I303_05089 [Kwoniella dejecticola CBS 10117]